MRNFEDLYKKEEYCWEWLAQKDKEGYGIYYLKGIRYKAHRYSLAKFDNISIPNRSVLCCHRCDNPSCVNPHHLFWGNSLDNTNDMMNKGRWRGGVSLGEKCGNSVLTVEKVRKIRDLYPNKTMAELSKEFNTTTSNICSVVYRNTWRHV